jgi:putative protein-disulfide isomerase
MNMKPDFEKLYYFADPMCSWCYGFGPAMRAFAASHPALPVITVMGGLRAFTTEPLGTTQRGDIRSYWRQVESASAQPFNDAMLMTPGFIYDTEQVDALEFMYAVQAAFYRDARDVTKANVLADIAMEQGVDRAAFLAELESQKMRDATRNDFALVQTVGIRGFPALCAARDNELHPITSGFAKIEALEAAFARLQ